MCAATSHGNHDRVPHQGTWRVHSICCRGYCRGRTCGRCKLFGTDTGASQLACLAFSVVRIDAVEEFDTDAMRHRIDHTGGLLRTSIALAEPGNVFSAYLPLQFRASDSAADPTQSARALLYIRISLDDDWRQ